MMWWRTTATALAARRLSLQAPAWRPLQLAVAASGSASPAFVPPLHASGSIFVRTLRGGRSQRRRAAQAAYEAELAAAFKREQKKAARAARPPPPPPAVPSYIRVRDLAKLLRKPVEDVLKKVATRRNRRLHVTVGSDRFEFKNIKEVILPFHVAEQVAAAFDMQIAFDDVEPTLLRWPQRTAESSHIVERTPVIAVMGHVDHGKTTLMDTLRGSSIAAREVHGITQKINICEAQLTPSLRATFLDTPGHFHFFRMRNNAAQVADLVVLIVAADEGCLLQTEESIGAIEETGLPVIACVNKIDLASPEQIESVRAEIRSFVALQTCPIVEISGKTGQQLAVLKEEITQLLDTQRQQRKLEADIGPDVPAQGLVLESLVLKGRGTVLRVLLKHGVLKKQDHFVAGMIHGVVRSVRNSDSGVEVPHALPGMVVDVAFANKSKNVDAPIEFGFFVLPEARARQVIETRYVFSIIQLTGFP
jgi:translation initiation factor IF-2